ncbi:MAG TPA: alkaline phosphatase family protein [Longimicrobium sp.]|nr:alkaline phosphatase family protein [Longimicrobium sp.]
MKRRWVVGALAVAVLLLAGVAFLEVTGNAPEEMAELAAQGGEKVLREPMRAARGAPRVLVFALDGVGDEELRAAVAGGRAPRIARLLGRRTAEADVYAHAYAAPGVLSILPSTTFAAWTSMFTGRPPAETGVPGNEWFAREEDRFYAPAPVTVPQFAHTLEVYTDGLMGRVTKTPTLYEMAGVRSYVSLAALHRGADLVTTPSPEAVARLAAAAAEGAAQEGESVSEEVYSELDRSAVRSLLRSIETHGPADLQVVYFPGVDLWTHVAPRPLEEQRKYVRTVIDRSVGEVLDAYRRAGALEGTYVLFVADHGHTPVLSDDRHSLGTGEENGGEPPDLLRRAGFRVRPFALEGEEGEAGDHQAVLAYQGAFAYVYLADRSTCPNPGDRCDWRRPPRLEEDVLPVARAFEAAGRAGAGVPELRGTIDLVFARPPVAPGAEARPFEVWDGARLVPVGAWLAAHPRPDLLDLERRMEGLGAGPWGHRAGDVALLARSGADRPIGERFYFSGLYSSWHGSPSAQDSRIPLFVALPGGDGAALRETVRRAVGERPTQLDVTRLVLALLGKPAGD